MKIKEIVEKKDKDLIGQLKESELGLKKLKFKIATKEIEKTADVSRVRKEIARIKTILREREISREEEDHEKKT